MPNLQVFAGRGFVERGFLVHLLPSALGRNWQHYHLLYLQLAHRQSVYRYSSLAQNPPVEESPPGMPLQSPGHESLPVH